MGDRVEEWREWEEGLDKWEVGEGVVGLMQQF